MHLSHAPRAPVRLRLVALLGVTAVLMSAAGVAGAQRGVEVSITEGPAGVVSETDATFAFVASQTSSFFCSLDRSRPTTCTSPVTYRGLSVGDHEFTVTAIYRDRGGNDMSASETRRWTVAAPARQEPEPEPAPEPAPAPQPRSDGDSDGSPTTVDLCPATSRRLDPAWRGCAAVELIGVTDLVADPVLGQLGDASRLLAGQRALKPARPQVVRARSLIARASELLASGEPCAARASYGTALARLRRAMTRIDAVYEREARHIARKRSTAPDVTPAQMQLAILDLERALARDAIATAARAGKAFGAACGEVRGRVRLRGEIAATDDAAGLVRLRGGRMLALHAETRLDGPIAAGAKVAVTGAAMKGKTVLADSLTSAGPDSQVSIPNLSGCLALRVAPVQPTAPYVPHASTTLHDPQAYRLGSGPIVLETLSRVAVAQVGCPGMIPDGKFLFYGASIVERLGANSETIATDMAPGETPVYVGQLVEPGETGTLEITTHVQACTLLANGVNDCDAPIELDTKTTKFTMVPVASLAEAVYSDTVFGIQGNGIPGDFEIAKVTGVKTTGTASPAAGFEATGYKVSGGGSSRPIQLPVKKGEQFAVYSDDFFEPAWGSFYAHGTVNPAALRWPHVVGERNGQTFWYAATLPAIVRDRIALCMWTPGFWLQPPGGESPPADPFFVPSPYGSTHYRLPFESGFQPGTALMNIDDPALGHRHPEHQAFALDLLAPDGTKVLAARGGTVKQLEDKDPFNAADAPKPWRKIGNYIWIQHEDGTLAVYFHNKVNTAQVKKGQHVHRGQLLALVGKTGQAGEPHVHIGAFRIVNGEVIPDVRVTYEALVQPIPHPLVPKELRGCHIPRFGEWLWSTNFDAPD